MRLLLGTGCIGLFILAFAACSGSSAAPDGTSEDQSNEAPTPGPAASATTPKAPVTPPPSEKPATDAGAGEGGKGDGGGAGGGDGGGGGKNPECLADSVHESESNDTPATANAIPNATGSFCGTLSSATDVDYLSFTLPATATQLGFADEYTLNGVSVEAEVGGVTTDLGKAPFKPGAKYTLKVHTAGKAPVNYRVSVSIK
jgi:hypothetical protein